MALSDGAHTMLEDFSYFTLLNKAPSSPKSEAEVANQANERKEYEARPGDSSLFGIACTRQIRSDKLKRRSADVTRSSVQKSVVVILRDVRSLGELRTRLGMVTEAWFAQGDFSDTMILKEFQESLVRTSTLQLDERDQFSGLSLREVIHEFRHQTLMLVKCLLLQRKMLFFGSKCERLCLLQFALLSLLPGLLSNLEDCAHPSLSSTPLPPTNETGRSRSALQAHMGLPLQVFGSGAFFGPYTPLQHLDILASYSTKSYVVGSTNSLLLQSQSRYADVLINLDDDPISISILSPSLKQALQLSAADRRWIDYLTQTVLETWDPEHPSRPKGMGYTGSEEAIRLQFEEYVLSLCSCAAYQVYREQIDVPKKRSFESISRDVAARREGSTKTSSDNVREQGTEEKSKETSTGAPTGKTNTVVDLIDADPAENATDFGEAYLNVWQETRNYQDFISAIEGKRIFEMVEPRHPTAGGFNIDDVQRRLQQNIADLHLDERYRQGREQASKMYEVGRERWKEGTSRLWAEIERRRDSNRSHSRGDEDGERQKEDNQPSGASTAGSGPGGAVPDGTVSGGASWTESLRERASKVQKPDTAAMQAAAKENAAKAGAYLSSWGSWAREKGKGWNEQRGRKSGEGTGSGG